MTCTLSKQIKQLLQNNPAEAQRDRPFMWTTFFALAGLTIAYILNLVLKPSQPTPTALTPILSPPGGYYDHNVELVLTPPESGMDVIFTVDGSVPTYTVGTPYTQALHMNVNSPAVTIIRARAVLSNSTLGPVVSASYFVGVQAKLPMLSLIMDPDDLWDPDTGLYTNPYMRGDAWERPVDLTYVDADRASGFHSPAGVRIHGQWSRSFDKKSLRLYFRREYGNSRLTYPLFGNHEDPQNPTPQSFKRLVLHNGGQDWPRAHTNWTLIRNQLAANLAFEHNAYATHSQPALLFINGKLWGIYQIRERLDEHYLAERGIDAADYLETPELAGQREIHMGDSKAWDYLMHFIETNDLSNVENYAYIQTQVDIETFMDYWALQIYSGNIDWPHHNVELFRPRVQGGRWQWAFWDSDHGFTANLYSYVGTDMITRLLDYDHPETGGRDALLLRKLLENPTFRGQFLSRMADLLNTTLTPHAVLAHIDALASELAPDIVYEDIRWASSMAWDSSIQELRAFARQRPDYVRQHIVDQFSLDGTSELIFAPPTSGEGYVAVNGFLIQDAPWKGTYFKGLPIQIIAAPEPGYRFIGWEPATLPQTAVLTLTVSSSQTITPRFEPLPAHRPRPGDVVFVTHSIGENTSEDEDVVILRVTRLGGVDLRGWRVTDNDTKTATDEGSLIFTYQPAFARVPWGTTIRIITRQGLNLPPDDANVWDRTMTLYTGNNNLNIETDPMFHLGPNDNLVLLAPGPTEALGDDIGIAFVSTSRAVTPASFGILSDGVLPTLTSDVQTDPEQSMGALLRFRELIRYFRNSL